MNCRGFHRLCWMSLCLILLGAAGVRGDVPPVMVCPWVVWYGTPPGDDFEGVAADLQFYPGETLQDVTLYLSFPAAGTYTLSLAANQGEFDGAALGTAT